MNFERVRTLERHSIGAVSLEQRLKGIVEIWHCCIHSCQPDLLFIRNALMDRLGILMCDDFIKAAILQLDGYELNDQGRVVRL
jgi:hypothetical protein